MLSERSMRWHESDLHIAGPGCLCRWKHDCVAKGLCRASSADLPMIGELFQVKCVKPDNVVMMATVHILKDACPFGESALARVSPVSRAPLRLLRSS